MAGDQCEWGVKRNPEVERSQQENHTALRKQRCKISESKGGKPSSVSAPPRVKGLCWTVQIVCCGRQFPVASAAGHGREFGNSTKQIPALGAEYRVLEIAVNADTQN